MWSTTSLPAAAAAAAVTASLLTYMAMKTAKPSVEDRGSEEGGKRRAEGITRSRSLSEQQSDIEKRMEDLGFFNAKVGPMTNARYMLRMVADKMPEGLDREMITYALLVTKMDQQSASMPKMLSFRADSRRRFSNDAEQDMMTLQYLRSNYAGLDSHHFGLRTVGKAVQFALRLRRLSNSEASKVCDTAAALPYSVTAEEGEAILDVLRTSLRWDFDVFELDEVTGGRPLQTLGWYILNEYDMVHKWELDPARLINFLACVEGRYLDNPYHNSTHAADVLQTTFFFLKTGEAEKLMSEMDILAILLAAIVHDVEHDGMSNDYHKARLTDKALLHNSSSVQERNHIARVYLMMAEDESLRFMEGMRHEAYMSLRAMLISLVLGTDMSLHFVNLKEFSAAAEECRDSADLWGAKERYKDMLMWAVLHSADISAQAKPWPNFVRWSDRCYDEFFRQGEVEKANGMPVSPMCDRGTTKIPQSQVGFVTFVVLPMFQALERVCPTIKESVMPVLESNLEYWTKETSAPSPSGKTASGGAKL